MKSFRRLVALSWFACAPVFGAEPPKSQAAVDCQKLWIEVRALNDVYEKSGGEKAARRLLEKLPRSRELAPMDCAAFSHAISGLEYYFERRTRDRKAGRPWALALEARMLRTSDAGYAEDLLARLGEALESHPRAFLQAWKDEYGESDGCAVATNLGDDGVDQPDSFLKKRYQARLDGLLKVRDAGLARVRDRCAATLRAAIAPPKR